MWDEQVERMERYYRRCERIEREATDDSVEDDNDTIYSFFMHCYHLKDWFNRDPEYQHQVTEDRACQNPKCAECYMRKSEALTLCQQLCNGIKHLNSTGPMPGRGTNVVTGEVWFFIRSRERTEAGPVSKTRGGVVDRPQWVDTCIGSAFEALTAARNAWKGFIVSAGAVESDEGYEVMYGT